MEEEEKQTNEGVDGEINDSPIEEVRLTVPITDDPTLPVLTFRTWVLGPLTCAVYAFLNQFFSFRRNAVNLSGSCLTIMILLAGKLMAKTLPTRPITIPILNWSFSMNPGPFNIKEHVVLSILVGSVGVGSSGEEYFGITVMSLSKVFYHKNINFWSTLVVIQTSQLLGYGFAGVFMKFLVNSPYMWFPLTLIEASYYRTLNSLNGNSESESPYMWFPLTLIDASYDGTLNGDLESESPRQKKKTRQLFIVSIVTSFAYAIIPSYFLPSLAAISTACLIWDKSVIAQIIGSGLNGLGFGSFSLDWNTISGNLGNPLAYPYSTILNTMVGFLLFSYVIIPIAYWTNAYNAKRFPLFSYDLFDSKGQPYDASRIVTDDIKLDHKEYQNYSKIYLSAVFAFLLGIDFANIASTITHFLLNHSRDAYQYYKDAYNNNRGDVHNRLMKKYKRIPQWWFLVILLPSVVLAILNCEVFDKQLQLPYWGILLSCLLVIVLLLPFSVLMATTGQSISSSGISQMLWGYVSTSHVIATWVFKTYSVATMNYAIGFLSELKLAHYMKIPLRSIFVAQVVRIFIESTVRSWTAWWIITNIQNICRPGLLPEGSPWTCPVQDDINKQSVVWGIIGSAEIFYPRGIYSNIYYFFLIGAIATATIWGLAKMFPKQKWIASVHIPNILSGVNWIIDVGSVSYWSWFIVGTILNFFIYRKYKDWWGKYNYTLANGLDLGTAILALFTSFTLQLNGIYGINRVGKDVKDYCPLATCPTAPGIWMDGCPLV